MVKFITKQEAISLCKEYSQTKSKQDQRALCCLLGAYTGDNLGNYNEFSKSISEKELDKAMEMPGNGAHHLIPGQSTDDTELATSMGYGIIDNPDPNVFDCNLISKFYTLWLQSPPFDIGNTIGSGLRINSKEILTYETTDVECKRRSLAQRNRYSTTQWYPNSKSNGGVMRITPLCVFLSKQTDQNTIRRVVNAEQTLTHFSKTPREAAYVYVRIVTSLIKGMTATEVYSNLTDYFEKECKEEEVKQWWVQKYQRTDYDNAVESMGKVQHALSQCFIALYKLSQEENKQKDTQFKKGAYKTYIREILRLCGDSDTNAAIVGGMLGAYLTLDEFPQDYLNKLISCDLQDKNNPQLYRRRQPIYNPRNCIYLCDQLLKKASNNPNISIVDEKLTEDIFKQIQESMKEK